MGFRVEGLVCRFWGLGLKGLVLALGLGEGLVGYRLRS